MIKIKKKKKKQYSTIQYKVSEQLYINYSNLYYKIIIFFSMIKTYN